MSTRPGAGLAVRGEAERGYVHAAPKARPACQRGGIAVSLVAVLGASAILLGAVQIGYQAYMQRELQKAADLAALSGAQVLGEGDAAGCIRADAEARAYAHANLPALRAAAIQVDCGVWEAPSDTPDGATPDGFRLPGAGESALPRNALRVRVSHDITPLLPLFGASEGRAAAQARATPEQAIFSVGSRLMQLGKGGLVDTLLTTAGLQPQALTVLDSDGLINARVTSAGLLEALGLGTGVALGAGTPQEVARLSSLSVGEMLDAMATVLGRSGITQADLAAFDLLRAGLQGTPLASAVPDWFGAGGVIDLSQAGRPDAALQAGLGLGDLVTAMLAAANGSNAIALALPEPAGALGVSARVQVVSPPAFGVGGKGTRARSAMVRAELALTTAGLLDLPLLLEVSSSEGTLTEMCGPPVERDQARIAVDYSLVNLCIGRLESAAPDAPACVPGQLGTAQVNLLGVVSLPVSIPALALVPGGGEEVVLRWPERQAGESQAQVTAGAALLNETQLTDLLAGQLLAGLLGRGSNPPGGAQTALADALLGAAPAGRPIAEVINQLQGGTGLVDGLFNRINSDGLLAGLVGGTLGLVGGLLDGLNITVRETACALSLTPQARRNCRRNAVVDLAMGTASRLGGSLAGLGMLLIEPLLDRYSGQQLLERKPLSTGLQGLFDLLGVDLGVTDVRLHHLQCGGVELVR